MADSSKNRRPAHPHAVSSFTRKQMRDYPNMHPEGHVHLPPTWNGDKRRYATYMRKLKEWKKANGQGGKRRGTRTTRRR